MFFTVLVNVAFKKLGCPEFNQEKMDKCLDAINSYYVGNGWYQDGPSDRYDHYIAFALHYYGLIYSVFMNEDDPKNSQGSNYRGCEVGGGPGLIITASSNTNLLYPRMAIPAVRHTIKAGVTEVSAYVMIFP